jgi:hypothetical protein
VSTNYPRMTRPSRRRNGSPRNSRRARPGQHVARSGQRFWPFSASSSIVIVIVNASSSKTPTGTATADRYASASQVVAALGHVGLACTNPYYGNPVVPGASSEASCDLG